MDRIISTAKMILTYLESNDLTIADLAEASNMSQRTIRRLINDESKLTYDVATGLNSLLPEISIDYLLTYDAVYQLQKTELIKRLDIFNGKKAISYFQLKQLYPHIKSNSKLLIEKGVEVFGEDAIKNFELPSLPSGFYSKANKSFDEESKIWTFAAYRDCIIAKNNKLLDFNRTKFEECFETLKTVVGSTSIDGMMVNIRAFCEECGINFFYRPSIPNARIKGVCIQDQNGRVFILLSDLFKSVEVLGIAFVHECFHLKKQDFDNPSFLQEGRTAENELCIDSETKTFFIGNTNISIEEFDEMKAKDIYSIAEEHNCAPGIVASILRSETGVFTKYKINALLHFYDKYSFV